MSFIGCMGGDKMNFRELSFAAIREMRDYPEGYDILDVDILTALKDGDS